jgi:arsenate reductase-like glutaredoxin family protein
MELTIFGIKNCDTMKKAMNWLDENGIDYHFHDYKKEGVPEQRLRQWLDSAKRQFHPRRFQGRRVERHFELRNVRRLTSDA